MLSRIPLRLRLTLGFTAVMALVLAATGALLHARLRSELDAGVDRGLRASAADVAALVQQADRGLSEAEPLRLSRPSESLAQVIDRHGHVVDASAPAAARPLLSPEQIDRARRGTSTFNTSGAAPGDRMRLLAAPVHAQDQRLLVVVGSSLRQRDEALSGLRTLLLIGGPATLLLSALAGYGLAAAALRPLDATLARLERSLRRERTFVADASHELLTPIAVLHAELELAADRHAQAAAGTDLRSATHETERLTRLAQDLLLLARSDEGGMPLRRERIVVCELLDAVAVRFATRAREAGRALRVEATGELVVEGDRLRLEQVAANLLDNALEHGAGAVTLSARRAGEIVELHVRDRGPGLAPEFAPRAFERFSRAGAGGRGSGLGLAIVAAVAESHGGSAHAAPGNGAGADMWVALPAPCDADARLY